MFIRILPSVSNAFIAGATKTLDQVKATFHGRGDEYGDTWNDCQFLVMRATAKRLGAQVPDDAWRALAAAAHVDMKYQRLQGGYKADSLVDGIAYSGYLTSEVDAVMEKRGAQGAKEQ